MPSRPVRLNPADFIILTESVILKEGPGIDKCYLPAKLPLIVTAIPMALLKKKSWPVPNQLMRYCPVNDELPCNVSRLSGISSGVAIRMKLWV